jgi:ATP-dependent helicase YprA (DUF1998 family)
MSTEVGGVDAAPSKLGIVKERKRKSISNTSEKTSSASHEGEESHDGEVKKPAKKPRASSSGKISSSLSEDNLPVIFRQLLMFYDLCDKIYCFLYKMNMKCSIENLERMYGQLYPFSSLAGLLEWQEFCPMNLVKVCAFCSDEFLLTDYQVSSAQEGEVTKGSIVDSEDSNNIFPTGSKTMIELTFKRFLGIGKGNIEKRRKSLIDAMTQIVVKDFLEKSKSVGFPPMSSNEVVILANSSGWPDSFLVNECSLPDFHSQELLLRNARHGNETNSYDVNTSSSTLPEVPSSNKKARILPKDGFSENCAGELTYALAEIRKASFYRGQLRNVSYFPARAAIYADLDEPLPDIIRERIESTYRISKFYRHQAVAINAIRRGRHVMISTSTASGKSLVFNLPVVERLLEDEVPATALYLFPTKALAQDQLRSLTSFLGPSIFGKIVPVVCDGDTSHGDRMDIMKGNGNIILTNPDMLHHTLLPDHKSWQRVFSNLRFVVLDEAHLYNGSFGTHVACVLRRLLRVCLAYNSISIPQFVCCSATISNPLEHICKLLPLGALMNYQQKEMKAQAELNAMDENSLAETLNVAIIGHELDGAPHGERSFIIWNPHGLEEQQQQENIVDNDPPSEKLSSLSENEIDELAVATDELQPALMLPKTTTLEENTSPKREKLELDEKLLKNMSHGSQNVSIIYETAVLFAFLIQLRMRTIAFCKTRKLVELVYKYCLRELEQSGCKDLTSSVSSYRGGYTDKERRSIEQELFAHRLLGVAATCALELGIDVGSLDVTMHLGFPGSFSSLWQQAGRAGRSGRASLSFILCFECPIDQYFARNPERLLSKAAIEPAVLDVDNLLILKSHLACAAKEIPLNFGFQYLSTHSKTPLPITDLNLWGKNYIPTAEVLLDHYSLRPVTKHILREKILLNETLLMLWSDGSYAKNEAARKVNLRMIDPITIDIVDDTKSSRNGEDNVIDSLEYSRAFFELFENAIFLHRAQQYLVRLLDLPGKKAHTIPVKVKYMTSARNSTTITVIKDVESTSFVNCPSVSNATTGSLVNSAMNVSSNIPAEAISATNPPQALVHYGIVQVVHRVFGYMKRWLKNGEVFEIGECSLPPLEYETTAVWVDLPVRWKHWLEHEEKVCPIASMHAANHVLLHFGALVGNSGCNVSDLGTEHELSAEVRPDTHPFRMMVYDKRPGGLGACANIFICMAQVLVAGIEVLRGCSCRYGCPSCILDCRYGVGVDSFLPPSLDKNS